MLWYWLKLTHLLFQTGDTALHVACAMGFMEIASILIAQGAPLRARNNHGQRALDLAKTEGYAEIEALILSALARGTLV